MQNETQPIAATTMKKNSTRRFIRHYLPAILVLLVIALGLTSAYFYKKSTSREETASQAEIKSLVEKVGRILVVPTDETPTVATVSDPEALKDQAFFADAKKGDKVLIYSNAKKAVLYDPVADKIVTVAPLNIDPNAGKVQAPAPTTDTTTKAPAPTTKKK